MLVTSLRILRAAKYLLKTFFCLFSYNSISIYLYYIFFHTRNFRFSVFFSHSFCIVLVYCFKLHWNTLTSIKLYFTMCSRRGPCTNVENRYACAAHYALHFSLEENGTKNPSWKEEPEEKKVNQFTFIFFALLYFVRFMQLFACLCRYKFCLHIFVYLIYLARSHTSSLCTLSTFYSVFLFRLCSSTQTAVHRQHTYVLRTYIVFLVMLRGLTWFA